MDRRETCPKCKGVGSIVRSYGAVIADLRKRQGMTQGELAEKLGMSRTQVTNIENEGSGLTAKKIVALAQIFCVSTDVVLGIAPMPAAKKRSN